MTIDIPFTLKGSPGLVCAAVEATTERAAFGAHAGAEGLPHCTATIEYAGMGYHRLMGWVQLVRSTDNESHGRTFEMDPFDAFDLYTAAPTPYAFFGIAPTLFDAPARDERIAMDWVAQSYLAWSPFQGRPNVVTPIAGFRWGFEIDPRGNVQLTALAGVSAAGWNDRLPYLRESYPGWLFDEADAGDWPNVGPPAGHPGSGSTHG